MDPNMGLESHFSLFRTCFGHLHEDRASKPGFRPAWNRREKSQPGEPRISLRVSGSTYLDLPSCVNLELRVCVCSCVRVCVCKCVRGDPLSAKKPLDAFHARHTGVSRRSSASSFAKNPAHMRLLTTIHCTALTSASRMCFKKLPQKKLCIDICTPLDITTNRCNRIQSNRFKQSQICKITRKPASHLGLYHHSCGYTWCFSPNAAMKCWSRQHALYQSGAAIVEATENDTLPAGCNTDDHVTPDAHHVTSEIRTAMCHLMSFVHGEYCIPSRDVLFGSFGLKHSTISLYRCTFLALWETKC